MELTTKQIAELLNGRLVGDPNEVLTSLAKIEEAESGSISFLANPKYESFLYTTRSSLIIVNDSQILFSEIKPALLYVENAYTAFTILLNLFNPSRALKKSGIDSLAFVDKSAKLDESVYTGAFSYVAAGTVIAAGVQIYPQVYIGENVKIGTDCILFPGVKVYNNSVIGNNVTLHSGVVIGSDGFGFAPQTDGSFTKISQIGNVIIEDDVEIGSNTCIDRATVGSTIIRRGVKLDNLIQVAHNVEIGAHTVIAAQAGIAGSTKLGENCFVGGQVGFVGHLSIAAGTQISAQSGIMKSIKIPGKQHRGSPSMPIKDCLKSEVVYKNLPALEKRIRELELLIKEKN